MVLLITGAKLWAIYRFGNAAPYLDDWHGEGRILKAWYEGTLNLNQLFEPHNEHRMALTRILSLILTRANNQWDNFLEMVAQVPLHVAAIVGFVLFAGAGMRPLGRVTLAVIATTISMIPFGWENTLWGFQSAFYFAMLFGIAALWLCWRYEVMTWQWCLGALLAFVNLFSNAGGVFFALALAAYYALLLLAPGHRWRSSLTAFLLLGAIAAFGIATTPHLPRHDSLAATSFHEFFSAFTAILSWPCDAHWACIILQAPLILLTFLTLCQRIPFSDPRWFPLIAGLAYWFQVLATSWKRCKGWDASRYNDSWCMMLIIIAASLIYLAGALGPRRRAFIYPIAAAWLGLCAYGMLDRAINLLPGELIDRRATTLEVENDVRGYLTYKDPAYLTRISPPPNPIEKEMLDSDTIQHFLPSSLLNPNPALTAANQLPAPTGFTPASYPVTLPVLNKPIYSSYVKTGDKSPAQITLTFQAPPGTRQIDLQVAGYPATKGIDLSIKETHGVFRKILLPADPGEQWETISIPLKSTLFTLKAKDQSPAAWLAFSAPTVSPFHPLATSARWLTAKWLYLLDLGLVLFSLAATATLLELQDPVPPTQ